jgi:hypothetical protein
MAGAPDQSSKPSQKTVSAAAHVRPVLKLIRADVHRSPPVRYVGQIHVARVAIKVEAAECRRHVDTRQCTHEVIVAVRGVDKLRRTFDDVRAA